MVNTYDGVYNTLSNQPMQEPDPHYKKMWVHERNRRIEAEQEIIRLRSIIYNPKFSANERAVAIEIADQVKEAKHTDENGRKLFSQNTAMQRLGLSKGTISKAVDVLTESGYVKDKETSALKDKEGKVVRNKKGLPISVIHLNIEQDLYEDFSKAERSIPRKVGKDRKAYTWQCQTCLTQDITIETDRYLVCKNPNCTKHGKRVLIDTSYEDQVSEESQDETCAKEDEYRAQNLHPKELLDNRAQNLYPKEAEDESNKHTHTASPSPGHDSILKEWLKKRYSGHIIYATGSLDPKGKYMYKPQGYQPDLDAYIAADKNHIYGSRLLIPETDLTHVLCFEVDRADQDAQAENYLWDLARAGSAAVYWQRYAKDRRRGHLEIYFDRPVNAEIARQWALEVCPDLTDIPEVYPCQYPEDKRNQGLSWPLYQRIDETVYPSTAKYMLPVPHTGELQECDPTDKQALASLITLAVTPAALVEEFETVLCEREKLQPREQGQASVCVCFIGQKPRPSTQASFNADLSKQVIADFCARYSWDDIAAMAGGWDKGYFKAVWRGERTGSVKPDKDGRYACDYGNHGSFPKKLDIYGAYCLIHGIDQRADLAERCAELRHAEMKGVQSAASSGSTEAPATWLLANEGNEQVPVYYTPCVVCGKLKSMKRADGVLYCGTNHAME